MTNKRKNKLGCYQVIPVRKTHFRTQFIETGKRGGRRGRIKRVKYDSSDKSSAVTNQQQSASGSQQCGENLTGNIYVLCTCKETLISYMHIKPGLDFLF